MVITLIFILAAPFSFSVFGCVSGPWNLTYNHYKSLCSHGACGDVFLAKSITEDNGDTYIVKTPKNRKYHEIVKEIEANRAIKEIFKQSNFIADIHVVLSECDYMPANLSQTEPWLSFKYYSNGDLRNYHSLKKQLSLEELRIVAYDVLTALSALNRNNWTHGDVKLDNLVISKTYQSSSKKLYVSSVKLIDLGYARQTTSKEPYKLGGTMLYLPPELLDLLRDKEIYPVINLFKKMYMEKADTWALGVSLFMLATGNFFTQALKSRDLKKTASILLDGLYKYYKVDDGMLVPDFGTYFKCNSAPSDYNRDACFEFTELLDSLLSVEVGDRCTAGEALQKSFVMRSKLKLRPENSRNVVQE